MDQYIAQQISIEQAQNFAQSSVRNLAQNMQAY